MSVLIKNMEMPEHCGYCRFRYDGICHALQKTQYSEKECPLVSVNDINAAPTIEPQQWIPVTEKLPGYGEDVLVSIYGYCNVGHIVPTNDEKQYNWYYSGWYHDPSDVVAWMPLPKPWEGEESE